MFEIVELNVIPGFSTKFLTDFRKSELILARQNGYFSHRLLQHYTEAEKFILEIKWTSIDAHQNGFRNSEGYQYWKKLLHKYYDPMPVVNYYVDPKEESGR